MPHFLGSPALSYLRSCFIFASILVLGGCSSVATYNLAYVPSEQGQRQGLIDGKGLVYTEKSDDQYVFIGKPTSVTGAASTLTIPLGAITKGVAEIVFRQVFRGGIDSSNTLENLSQYKAVIKPKMTNFTYEYNQAKNIGFAITPTVQISLVVELLDKDGKPYWKKDYASGIQEGPAYLINTSPGEEISKLAHKATHMLMTQAAADIESFIASQHQKPDQAIEGR